MWQKIEMDEKHTPALKNLIINYFFGLEGHQMCLYFFFHFQRYATYLVRTVSSSHHSRNTCRYNLSLNFTPIRGCYSVPHYTATLQRSRVLAFAERVCPWDVFGHQFKGSNHPSVPVFLSDGWCYSQINQFRRGPARVNFASGWCRYYSNQLAANPYL